MNPGLLRKRLAGADIPLARFQGASITTDVIDRLAVSVEIDLDGGGVGIA